MVAGIVKPLCTCSRVVLCNTNPISQHIWWFSLFYHTRYFAIFYPQKTIIRPDTAWIVIVVMWFVPMCIQTPWAIYYKYEIFQFAASTETMVICYPDFTSPAFERGFFLGVVFLTCYIAPLGFISICYSMIGLRVWKRNVSGIRGSKTERNIQRSKIRIVRMLVTVAVVFALFWLPLYSLRLYVLYGTLSSNGKRMVRILLPIVQWLGSANSCVNPFIYCYFSEQFKKSILYIFENRSCCGRIIPNTSNNSKTKSTAMWMSPATHNCCPMYVLILYRQVNNLRVVYSHRTITAEIKLNCMSFQMA